MIYTNGRDDIKSEGDETEVADTELGIQVSKKEEVKKFCVAGLPNADRSYLLS